MNIIKNQMKSYNVIVISDNELLSKVITFLRFPLIVGVVLLHMHMLTFDNIEITSNNYPFYFYVTDILTEKLARLSVPLFFVFSGYLFFCKISNLTWDIYKQKIKKRIRTLFIPYVFWNTLLLLFMLFRRFVLPRVIEGNLMSEWTLLEWINSYWGSVGGMPISLQFWFIRDLMIIMVLSPLLYRILSINRYIIFIMGLIWMFFDNGISSTGFSISSFFFFSLGAWYGIYKRNFVLDLRPFLCLNICLYPVLIILSTILVDYSWSIFLSRISIIIGISLIVGLVSHFIEHNSWTINKTLTDSNFFIFAYHIIALNVFDVLILRRLYGILPLNECSLWFVYIIKLSFIIILGVCFYKILKTYFPRFTAVITGGR